MVCLKPYLKRNYHSINPVSNVTPDTEPPIIMHHLKNLTINADPGERFAVVTWNEPDTVTDNSGSFTLTSNYQSRDTFPIGSTDVEYIATDRSGNFAAVEFVVIVKGTTLRISFPLKRIPSILPDGIILL